MKKKNYNFFCWLIDSSVENCNKIIIKDEVYKCYFVIIRDEGEKVFFRCHKKSKISKYIKNVKDDISFECSSNYLSKALIILLSFLF